MECENWNPFSVAENISNCATQSRIRSPQNHVKACFTTDFNWAPLSRVQLNLTICWTILLSVVLIEIRDFMTRHLWSFQEGKAAVLQGLRHLSTWILAIKIVFFFLFFFIYITMMIHSWSEFHSIISTSCSKKNDLHQTWLKHIKKKILKLLSDDVVFHWVQVNAHSNKLLHKSLLN